MNRTPHQQLGFIGIDQYGHTYQLSKYPRKELMEQLDAMNAEKMYCGHQSGLAQHIGYVIKGHWIEVYRIFEFHPVSTNNKSI